MTLPGSTHCFLHSCMLLQGEVGPLFSCLVGNISASTPLALWEAFSQDMLPCTPGRPAWISAPVPQSGTVRARQDGCGGRTQRYEYQAASSCQRVVLAVKGDRGGPWWEMSCPLTCVIREVLLQPPGMKEPTGHCSWTYAHFRPTVLVTS